MTKFEVTIKIAFTYMTILINISFRVLGTHCDIA